MTENGLIYLDNSATTRPFDSVIDIMQEDMRGGYFNPSSAYAQAMSSANTIKSARNAILDALNAKAYRCVFNSGATEGNNTAIFGALRAFRGQGHAVTTAGEHPSVIETFLEAKKRGYATDILSVDVHGIIDMDALSETLRENTALISVQWVNNETGAVQPIAEIAKLRDVVCPQALLHVDAVQGFLRLPLALKNSGIDMLTVSAHKVHGPKGVGALLLSSRAKLPPLLYGGGQEANLRSGTENAPGIHGFGRAVEAFIEHPEWRENLREMKRKLCEGIMRELPEAQLNGPAVGEGAPHILNMSIPGVRGEVLLHALEAKSILVSTGSACSTHKKGSHVLAAMGLRPEIRDSAIRLSLSPMNTLEEMETAAQCIAECAQALLPFRRK